MTKKKGPKKMKDKKKRKLIETSNPPKIQLPRQKTPNDIQNREVEEQKHKRCPRFAITSCSGQHKT